MHYLVFYIVHRGYFWISDSNIFSQILIGMLNFMWRSTIVFLRSWLISFDFHMMSSKEALSMKIGFEIHPQVHLHWLKWCQLAYQKLLKPWHTFLDFSKLFEGTVNLVHVNFLPTGIVIQWINYKWNNLSVNNCCKNYLCHAQSRCPNRLAKTIVC